MSVESASRPVHTGQLLVAFATLLLPLAAILSGALTQPTHPSMPAPAPALVAESVVEPHAEAAPGPVAVSVERAPPEPLPTPSPLPRWRGEDRMNLLLLGVDRRDPNEVYRTDSIVLANVDLRSRRAALISIPRDLVVTIPGYGSDRINTTYALGETQRRPGGGLGLLRETVQLNFGLPIHHYTMVDFNCFRGAVDALGGVNVNVPTRIYDPMYPTEDFRYQVITFEPGPQRLDGERALQYARSRYADTDFGRMRRQQQLLTALKEQALQVRTLGALPQAAQACSGLASDLNLFELVALGTAARDIRATDVNYQVIDERLAVPYVAPSGASVLLPRWEAIRAMVQSALNSATASAAAN